MKPKEVLSKYWNYNSFIGYQEEIISEVLKGKDILAILPTGGGKSLCYQIPSIIKYGLTLVISPLIALMKDQVKNIQSKGIPASYITNETEDNTVWKILDDCASKKTKLLYISPERLQSRLFIDKLSNIELSLITIDEAHCISEWGHDFRPAYHRISKLKKLFPKVNVLALTATATDIIQKEIIEKLALHKPVVFKDSLKRENLSYNVYLSHDKKKDLIYYLKKFPGSSIIFVRNRRLTYEIYKFLIDNGFDADYYHAKLKKKEKEKKQEEWTKSESRVIVSTNAFGMGIDKSNVRSVFHIDLPNGIEAYYQEVGRAGRDQRKAVGIYLYNTDDKLQAENNFKLNIISKNDFINISNSLFSQLQIAEGELPTVSYQIDILKFAEKYNLNLKKVIQFLNFLNSKDIIQQKNYTQNSTVRIKILPESLSLENSRIFEYIQRNYPGIFLQGREINESKIAFDLNLSVGEIRNFLHDSFNRDLIDYSDRYLTRFKFLVPRNSNVFKINLWKIFERIQIHGWKRLQAMVYYAEQNTICRERLLFSYFNQKVDRDCGKCDVCVSRLIKASIKSDQLLDYLNDQPRTKDEIFFKFINSPKDKILTELQFLIDELKIQPIGLDSYKAIE